MAASSGSPTIALKDSRMPSVTPRRCASLRAQVFCRICAPTNINDAITARPPEEFADIPELAEVHFRCLTTGRSATGPAAGAIEAPAFDARRYHGSIETRCGSSASEPC